MPASNSRGAEFWNGTMGRSWIRQQTVISEVFTAVTDLSLRAAGPRSGEHVIDVGCGTGDTLLALAKAVGPSGAVLGVDLSAPMLGLAEDRCSAAGLDHVSFGLADAATYAFAPHRADLVYSRFGVMFFDDPIAAFANIRSGMKRNGRLVFVCFRGLPESPWFHVPIEAARPHVPVQPPADPTAPGMFSFARADRLHGILAEAGFRDIALTATDAPMHGKDLAHSMAFLTQAGPLPGLLEAASSEQRERATEAVRTALAARIGQDGKGLHAGLWLVTASAS